MTEFKIGDLVMDNNGNTYKVVNDATPSIPYLLEAVKRVSKKVTHTDNGKDGDFKKAGDKKWIYASEDSLITTGPDYLTADKLTLVG